MTSRASISSEMRIEPSWAVNPQPTVAAESESGNERRDLTGVEIRRQEAGEGCRADGIERGVSLQANDGTGEQTETDHHADRAADDGECTGPECHLPEEPEDLARGSAGSSAGSASRTFKWKRSW